MLQRTLSIILLAFVATEVASAQPLRRVPVQCIPITYAPPHTLGDDDFGGDGPAITTVVWLYVNPRDRRQIMARVWVRAEEHDKWVAPGKLDSNRKNWTTGEGYADYVVAQCQFPVTEIFGPTSVVHHYVDRNHDRDIFGRKGFVKSFAYIGDTNGHDVSRSLRDTRTHVSLQFNTIFVR